MIHKGRDPLSVCTAPVIRKSNSSSPWSPWGGGGPGVEGFRWPLVLFWGDAHLERCRDCWHLSDGQPWALLDPFWHFTPPPFAHPCQTSHQWCCRLSRPWANSLLKQLFLILASPEVVVHRRCSSWQWTRAALCVSYKILLVSNFKLGALPWQKTP